MQKIEGLKAAMKEIMDDWTKLRAERLAVLEFLRTVGENDPRSGGFIAKRVLIRMNEQGVRLEVTQC